MLPAPLLQLKLLKTPIKAVDLTFTLCVMRPNFCTNIAQQFNCLFCRSVSFCIRTSYNTRFGKNWIKCNFFTVVSYCKTYKKYYLLVHCVSVYSLLDATSPTPFFKVTVPAERPREINGEINRRRPCCVSSLICNLFNLGSW
jgi:hypothetical protein